MDDEEVLVYLYFLILLYYRLQKNKKRRWWVRPINTERKDKGAFANLFTYAKLHDEETFFRYTRMSSEKFNKLLSILSPRLRKRSRRESISAECRLAMTLKYLAHGGSFWSLCWEFRVGHSTAASVVFETCEIIWEVLSPLYVKTPESSHEWKKISDNFQNKWQFPHTLGAIDGKHVQMQCPSNSGSLYYNYKHFFSLVLLAASDADYNFIWVDIGAYGSESDGGIFRRSRIGQLLESEQMELPPSQELPGSLIKMPFYFIGDEAFPLKKIIMRPYPGKYVDETKRIFNYRLCRARRVIENAFGILASRWRVYRQSLLCSVNTVEAVIKATICLHNFLRKEQCLMYCPPHLIDRELEDGQIINGEWREITRGDNNFLPVGRVGSNMSAREISNLRNQLAGYLTSPSGSVAWQNTYVNRIGH